jgi:hypothetical protein
MAATGYRCARTIAFRICDRRPASMQFGAKSERLPEEQVQLGLEALEQAIAK